MRRVVRALHGEPQLELVATSRRSVFIPSAAGVATTLLDINSADFAARLKNLAPGLVIIWIWLMGVNSSLDLPRR